MTDLQQRFVQLVESRLGNMHGSGPNCAKARMYKVLREVAENNCTGSKRESMVPLPKLKISFKCFCLNHVSYCVRLGLFHPKVSLPKL